MDTITAPIRVLLVGNFLSNANGSRGICEELALRLPNSGCSVLTTSSKRARLPRLLDMVGTVLRQRHRYAIAHVDVYSGPAFAWAETVCASLALIRKPYILTLHGGNLPRFAERRMPRVGRLLRSAAAVTTPSPYLRENFVGQRSDIHFIPNGLDLQAYTPKRRTAIGPRLVWLRAYHRVYNPSLAVRVLPLVVARYPDVHLTMVGVDKGDGSLAEARRLATQLGVSDRIDFGGGVDKRDVPAALSGGDVFLNTANVDSAPVTVVEAMACGMCVVTTSVGGIPYLVEHEGNGLLVPPDDPQAMADAVLRVLDDPALAARLSVAARQKAERYDWSPILDQWRRLFAATAARTANA